MSDKRTEILYKVIEKTTIHVEYVLQNPYIQY